MNIQHLYERYEKFWNCSNNTPILLLSGIKDYIPPCGHTPNSMMERWMDIDYLIERERLRLAHSFHLGDAFPLVNPNLGPDIFGASLGADIIFEESTSYSVPFVQDWTEDFSFHEGNNWWQKIKEITKAFVEDSRGEYFVGITDLHPGADGLASIRGSQNLCFDVIDQPEVFKNARKILLPAFQQQFEELCRITQKYQKGISNWMGLFKQDPWYVTSSDFICMVSNEDFQELIFPEIVEEIRYLKGNTIFHLDGPGALKHLDTLLEIPELAGIQWVYGAGQPSAKHWIDVLKKIQKKGKTINIGLQRDDIETIFSELHPQGLSCYFDFKYTEKEAIEILELANGAFRA
ncbi:hypothetical protein [Robinsoniella sp. KNHs210]|uniref:hypothetical protein n=1 Tax=Robinsoniella sp. KNHs210 TaxID=1469950 RepID=UPI0005C7B683|nr:hypothetical protein [Robinsoniella sp. KNHs210]